MLFYGGKVLRKGGWTGIVASAVRLIGQLHKAQTQEAVTDSSNQYSTLNKC